MYILEFAFKMSVLLYSLFYDMRLLYIFGTILGIYTIIHYSIKDSSPNTSRLNIRLGTWESPKDSNVYVKIVVPVTPSEEYFKKKFEEDGTRLTLTHIALKAIAVAVMKAKCNAKIVFGRLVKLPSVDISALVDIDNGRDLAQITVKNCDTASLATLSNQIHHVAKRIKEKKDTSHQDRTKGFSTMPDWVISLLMTIGGFVAYNMGMDFPIAKIKANAFGANLLTNVSKLGYRESFAPLVNFSRNAATWVLCEPYWEMDYDENGQNATLMKKLNFMCTVDHRFIDGSGGTVIMKTIKDVFANPEKYDHKD